MATIRDKLETALRNIGAKPVESRSGRYRVWEIPSGTKLGKNGDIDRVVPHAMFVFLGRAGACRWYSRNAASKSLDAPNLRKFLLTGV